MSSQIGKCLERIGGMEFAYIDDRTATRTAVKEARTLSEIAGLLVVKDPKRMLFKRMPPAEVQELLEETARTISGIKKLEATYETLRIKQAIQKKPQTWRTVFSRILENAVHRATEEVVWRNLMSVLSLPLYSGASEGASNEEDRLVSALCLRNIASTSMNPQKRSLAMDTLCGAIIGNDGRTRHEILLTMEQQQGEIQFATLAALISTRQKTGFAVDTLQRYIQRFCNVGQSEALAIMNGATAGNQDSHMMAHVMSGMRQIMNPRRIVLPHPWYLETPGYGRMPIPTMQDPGIHLSTFATLGTIPSGQALAVMTYGMSSLIIPHVEEINYSAKQFEGERSVLNALGPVAAALHSSLSLNGVRSPETLSKLLLGHPELLAPELANAMQLRHVSAVLFNIVENAELMGLSRRPIATTAMAALSEAMFEGVVLGDKAGVGRVLMNVRRFGDEYQDLFGRMRDDELGRKYRTIMTEVAKRKPRKSDVPAPLALLPPKK